MRPAPSEPTLRSPLNAAPQTPSLYCIYLLLFLPLSFPLNVCASQAWEADRSLCVCRPRPFPCQKPNVSSGNHSLPGLTATPPPNTGAQSHTHPGHRDRFRDGDRLKLGHQEPSLGLLLKRSPGLLNRCNGSFEQLRPSCRQLGEGIPENEANVEKSRTPR